MHQTASKAEEIFYAALELDSIEARSSYLDKACGDAELRRRVEWLLAHDAQAADFLEAPAAMPTATTAHEARLRVEGPGTTIGPYKLLELIGEGGMGAVYLADQSRPVRRRVALKVIKLGMDTRQVIARFEAERQALAMMDHPNIARVFDGGTTDAGRPYFVMELVRGIPITEYCDREQLSIPERLELFVLVCRAVQHAHQKGIIHRDLKPSNILVTVIDGAAVPKVIDFGVAKATGTVLTDRTLYTAFHQFVGTPLYMSPEQADLSGMDMDTRSDIYSLGVLLYELLTGTTPFDQDTFRKAAIDEIRRMIREDEPPRPSTRLSSLGSTRSAISANRKADARHLDRTVHGELDWIVMKALEKDRRRRYETANDFASDVMRHLTDKPVEACPPSAWYRFTKYSRRNRGFLATAGLIAVVLITATAVSIWQAAVARQAQKQAADETAIARAVSEFLQEDLLGQAPGVSRLNEGNPQLTVKEALDRASARIGSRFRDQPLVEAAIRTTIGTAYHRLQEQRSAVPHLERALALREVNLGPHHPDTLGSRITLAEAYSWVGRSAEAIALRGRVLEARMASLGRDHPTTLRAIAGLAQDYEWAGQWELSTQLLEDLLPRQERILGVRHPDTLGTMHLLARSYKNSDHHEESQALYAELLAIIKSTNGEDNESTIWPRMTFAQGAMQAGRLDLADQLLREALELHKAREDSQSRRLGIANTLGWLATTRLLQDDPAGAEPLAREAVAVFEALRPGDQRGFYWMSALGDSLAAQGRYDEAEPLLIRGYQGMKQQEVGLPAMERRRLARACERVVRFYQATGQAEKERAWREVLSSLPQPAW